MTRNEPNLMAQIPDMFHAQKECCFRAMEQDAFPRSLRSKAFGNLTPALVRLVVGLIVLWIGLAVGFLRCAAEIETLFLIYTILNRCLPHFTNTNWTPSSSSLANPKQHLSVPCAIRQKATIRTGHPGLYARYRFYRSPRTALLGCTWPSAMIVPDFFDSCTQCPAVSSLLSIPRIGRLLTHYILYKILGSIMFSMLCTSENYYSK